MSKQFIDPLLSGVFIYIITCNLNNANKYIFSKSLHRLSAGGSLLLQGQVVSLNLVSQACTVYCPHLTTRLPPPPTHTHTTQQILNSESHNDKQIYVWSTCSSHWS